MLKTVFLQDIKSKSLPPKSQEEERLASEREAEEKRMRQEAEDKKKEEEFQERLKRLPTPGRIFVYSLFYLRVIALFAFRRSRKGDCKKKKI